MKYRYDIQGLRALAVILVFLFHLDQSVLSGGYIGVDIFFVISGYLISSIILNKKEKKSFGFLDFYIGRFKRIVPVFVVFLLVVLFTGLLIYVKSDIPSLRKNLFWSSVFNSNNYLSTLDNYFGASSSENPLLHTWTLAIEMQVYFLLPFFVIFLKRKFLFPVCLFLIILLTGYSYYNIAFLNLKDYAYFSLLIRIPEFLIGVVFALIGANIFEKFKIGANIISIISIISIIGTSLLINENSNFPGFLVLIPCLAVGLLLVMQNSIVNKFFSNSILVHIGELSYSIYLWHWPIMAFIRYYNINYSLSLIEIIIITISTYLISYLSHKLIEVPFRSWNNKKSIISISLMYTVFGFLLFIMPQISSSISTIPTKYIQPVFGLDSHGSTFKNVIRYGANKKNNDSILLLGDSHGAVYKSFLNEIGKLNNFNFYSVTNNLYPTIPGIDEKLFSEKRYYDQYKKLMLKANDYIPKSKIIIIGSTWSDRIPSLANVLDDFMNSIDKTQKVIILSDYPILNKNPIRVNREITKTKVFDYDIKIKNLPKDLHGVIEKHKNLYYLNLDYKRVLKEIPFVNDTIAYYDDGHWNVYGSQKIGALMESQFMQKFKIIINE